MAAFFLALEHFQREYRLQWDVPPQPSESHERQRVGKAVPVDRVNNHDPPRQLRQQ